MPLSDRREIAFDAAAVAAVVACSKRLARTIGLPTGAVKRVQFDPDAGRVILHHGANGHSVPIPPGPLGALLISYCIRAKIKIPRLSERRMRVDRDAVVLVFNTTYPVPVTGLTPEPTEDAKLPRAMSWFDAPAGRYGLRD